MAECCNETLLDCSVADWFQINIKYGRALKPGEHRVQLYQLVVNDPEVTINPLTPLRRKTGFAYRYKFP